MEPGVLLVYFLGYQQPSKPLSMHKRNNPFSYVGLFGWIFIWYNLSSDLYLIELILSLFSAKETHLKESSTTRFMMWVLENTQAKINEFFEKIIGLVNMLFPVGDKDYDTSDDLVRMSFMLSVFVFIVVTIARIHWLAQQFADFAF